MTSAAWKLPRPAIAIAAATAFVVAHAWWAFRYPMLDIILAVLLAFAFLPALARAVLVVAFTVGPTVNPTLIGLGPAGGGTVAGGRVYVVQAALLLVILSAVVLAARNGMHTAAAAVVGSCALVVAVGTVGRPDAGPAWVYRPLQLFLVAFAVRSLFQHRPREALLKAMAWGGTIGCGLASGHALVPAVDPFAVSRPDNIPFASSIGVFTRATGAFTYPNNLGTFAAYTMMLGAAAVLLGRPALPRFLAWLAFGTGASALLLSGSRAAGLGALCGLVYLTFRLQPRRRALVMTVQGAVGLLVVVFLLSSPSAVEVASERIESAAGSSLALRVESWEQALDAFRDSPLIGTGASESRTDSFWLLYLAQGGIIGMALLAALARVSLQDGQRPRSHPELCVALLLALCVSGLLQDSLGQTVTSWFAGGLLGLCGLPPHPRRTARSSDDHTTLSSRQIPPLDPVRPRSNGTDVVQL